jgi:predicted glycosyltransferase
MKRAVWIDILTPKQALFFWPLIERLRRRGPILVTSRRYEQVSWALRLLDLGALVVGRFGGEGLEEKLFASTERQRLLARLVARERPGVALSSGSIEVARICFGLQVPHLLASDTPHSPVNKLCVPLSSLILTPSYIGLAEWRRWGDVGGMVVGYRALDPIAWIRRADELERRAGVKPPEDDYALVRVPEYKASYISGRGLEESVSVVKAVQKFFERVIVLCRYRGEAEILVKKLGRGVRLVRTPVLALPYIRGASLIFSGGGTIAQEAALIGKPVILFYPGETPAVHRFLARKGLLKVVKPGEIRELQGLVEKMSSERVRAKLVDRARKAVQAMEDPIPVIESRLLSFLD